MKNSDFQGIIYKNEKDIRQNIINIYNLSNIITKKTFSCNLKMLYFNQ